MRSWSIRFSMLGLMTVAMAGCDSNPEGPAAPTAPSPGGAATAPTPTPGVMPAGKARGKGSNAPLKAD